MLPKTSCLEFEWTKKYLQNWINAVNSLVYQDRKLLERVLKNSMSA